MCTAVWLWDPEGAARLPVTTPSRPGVEGGRVDRRLLLPDVRRGFFGGSGWILRRASSFGHFPDRESTGSVCSRGLWEGSPDVWLRPRVAPPLHAGRCGALGRERPRLKRARFLLWRVSGV